MKKRIKILRHFSGLTPGVYTLQPKLANYVLEKGIGVEYKEEKKVYQTKQEKFEPEVKEEVKEEVVQDDITEEIREVIKEEEGDVMYSKPKRKRKKDADSGSADMGE